MKSICHQFPIRPGFLAQVIIPLDLTKSEADRLRAFVLALARSNEAAKDSGAEGREQDKKESEKSA